MARPTLAQACAIYINRFTADHVPAWAKKVAPNGLFYAPQFASDKEWYENTKFYGEPGHIGVRHECYTSGQTWPMGQWLNTPYSVGGLAATLAEPAFLQFLRGYQAALYWSSTDEIDGETVNLDQFTPSTAADDHCRAACLAFFSLHRADIEAAAGLYDLSSGDGADTGFDFAGHDFALTRNGHGAGYWDRAELDVHGLGDRLTAAAKAVGECHPYLGNDRSIYIG